MQFTPALVNRPPRGPNNAGGAAAAAPDKRWVLADDS